MIKTLILLSALMLVSLQTGAQIHSQLYSGKQEMFLEAESFFLFEEYSEALPIYLELLKDQPDNSFLNYRVGSCYINTPGHKDHAVPYLEKAVENLDPRERRPTFRTSRAPLDALFYLGNAYHINYRFDDALSIYQRFRDEMNPSVYSTEIIDEHIQATRTAIESVGRRVFYREENLGERINTRFSETNPAVSGNGNVLAFTRRMPFYDAIFFSEKTGQGNWSWPVEITSQIGCDGDCYPVSLSWDGKELYLYKSDNLVGNIYVSKFEADEWSAIRRLNDNINTRFWESHASLSKNGDTLYFTSNRPGGFGGLDIYFSVRNEKNEWGPAVNLGPDINTPFNEDTPFISDNGRTLYFSSLGHRNMGGYDIFIASRRSNGSWAAPVNAGYGINTPDDDLFFVPIENGRYAYVSKFDNNGFGEMDIYRYEIFSDTNPRRFLVTGSIKRADGSRTGDSARIRVIDPVSGNVEYSDQITIPDGGYELSLEAGEWEIHFSEPGYENFIRTINLAADREGDELRLNVELKGLEKQVSEPMLTDLSLETDKPEVTDLLLEDDKPEVTDLFLEDDKPDFHQTADTGENLVREEAYAGMDAPEQEPAYDDPDSHESGTVIEPGYFDTPAHAEEETAEPGRAVPVRLILILAFLLLIAFYFKERRKRNKKS